MPKEHTMSLILSCLFVAPAATAGAVNVDWWRFVDCVAQIESGGDHRARGDRGRAAGAWQLHREAWADVSAIRRKAKWQTYPYSQAHIPEIARSYAGDYLALLAARLSNHYRRPASCAEIYAAYNLGPDKFINHYQARLGIVPAKVRTTCNRLEILVRAAQAGLTN
jgi:hypothetical protein